MCSNEGINNCYFWGQWHIGDMDGINVTLLLDNMVFDGNWYKWGSIKFDPFAEVRFV